MSTPPDMRIDSKGKYYTKIVSTRQLKVVMRLGSGETLEGMMHIRPDRRLSDELNDESPFLSITGVSVRSGDRELYRTAYLAVNRRTVEWVIPVDAIGQDDDHLDD